MFVVVARAHCYRHSAAGARPSTPMPPWRRRRTSNLLGRQPRHPQAVLGLLLRPQQAVLGLLLRPQQEAPGPLLQR